VSSGRQPSSQIDISLLKIAITLGCIVLAGLIAAAQIFVASCIKEWRKYKIRKEQENKGNDDEIVIEEPPDDDNWNFRMPYK